MQRDQHLTRLDLAFSRDQDHKVYVQDRSGFIVYAALAVVILIMLRIVSKGWTTTWVGKGGRALTPELEEAAIAAD